MRKRIIIALSIILVLIIAIPILIHTVTKTTHDRIYEENWRIDVPSDFIEEYTVSSERGFQGDGERYTIFEAKSSGYSIINSTYKVKGIETSTGSSTSNKDAELEQFVQTIVEDLKVPENNKPLFHEKYLWKKLVKNQSDELVILYFSKTNQVIFVERLL